METWGPRGMLQAWSTVLTVQVIMPSRRFVDLGTIMCIIDVVVFVCFLNLVIDIVEVELWY